MKVDIIIPNYNGSHLISNNIVHVVESMRGYEGKVIIVDDGSKKEDVENLRKVVKEFNSDRVELYEHPKNKGYSSAVNTGVRKSGADIVVLLNSDVIPSKDFLDDPLKRFEDTNLFAVGCLDESFEGDEIVRRGRGIGSWKRGMIQHSKGNVDKESTFWVSGGSSFFRREIYEMLGGMDEIYNPFYWEDIDLSYRAQKCGYTLLFDNKSIVKHFHEKGAIKSNFTSSRVTTIAYRNQFIFIWKNISDTHLLVNHILFLPVNILFALKGKDTNFLKGLFLAVKKLPDIIDKRKKQATHYKVSDIEIINKIS